MTGHLSLRAPHVSKQQLVQVMETDAEGMDISVTSMGRPLRRAITPGLTPLARNSKTIDDAWLCAVAAANVTPVVSA
jgi:hypothetical protein